MKRAIGLLGAALFVLGIGVNTVVAGAPGNNGTTKIEDSVNAKPAPANDPHVCSFDIRFYFADSGQTGNWIIQSWPPTGNKTTVLSGTYSTNSAGSDRQPAVGYYSLSNGHYKLFWKGSAAKLWKHKVFWVECATSSPSVIPSSGVEASEEAPCSDTDEIGDNDADNQPCPSSSVEAASETPSSSVEAASETPSSSVEAASETPSSSVEAASSSPSNSGGVLGVTAPPSGGAVAGATTPPTDTLDPVVEPSPNGFALALMIFGLSLFVVAFLTPKRS